MIINGLLLFQKMNQPRNTGNCCLAYGIIQGDEVSAEARSPPRGKMESLVGNAGACGQYEEWPLLSLVLRRCGQESQLTASLNGSTDKNLHKSNPRAGAQKGTEVGGGR